MRKAKPKRADPKRGPHLLHFIPVNDMTAKGISIGLLLATALSGCAATQPARDPHYAATMPILSTPPQPTNGAIYQAGYGVSLFEDTKAHRVGDILTVRLVEKTDASKKAGTSTAKDQSVDFGAPTLLGGPVLYNGQEILNNSASASREFDGEGSSSQSNSLSGSITVTVAEVLPNGNLLVRGEKLLTLNQGDEFIRFSGIVRPVDISADNSVASTKVANSQITYSGRGTLADANEMGWLSRFFNSALWPF